MALRLDTLQAVLEAVRPRRVGLFARDDRWWDNRTFDPEARRATYLRNQEAVKAQRREWYARNREEACRRNRERWRLKKLAEKAAAEALETASTAASSSAAGRTAELAEVAEAAVSAAAAVPADDFVDPMPELTRVI